MISYHWRKDGEFDAMVNANQITDPEIYFEQVGNI